MHAPAQPLQQPASRIAPAVLADLVRQCITGSLAAEFTGEHRAEPAGRLRLTASTMAGLPGATQSSPNPKGFQTGLTVFDPGRYRFLDITRYGSPLTLTMAVVVPLLMFRHLNL